MTSETIQDLQNLRRWLCFAMELCPDCKGTGSVGGLPDFEGDTQAVTMSTCGRCGGTGRRAALHGIRVLVPVKPGEEDVPPKWECSTKPGDYLEAARKRWSEDGDYIVEKFADALRNAWSDNKNIELALLSCIKQALLAEGAR